MYGRNYFARHSAPEQEEDEDADERAQILEDMMELKKAARAYLHPEDPVESAPEVFGRNYFHRAGAPEGEDVFEAEEHARVLAEAAALKKSAVDYMHPEIGVTSASGACFGRNYFNRPSAPATEEDEYADERAEILAEMAALKQSAVDYMHPEIGLKTTDATLFGRNYFNRASAPDMEDAAEAEEGARILAEAKALKQAAVDYMHPEIGVTSASPECFGRNYFNRASAPETEEDEFADERAEILAEMTALKQSAVDYLHPEIGVKTTDATLFGRNYFNRASAPDMEDAAEAEEHARILAEAKALKQAAVDYMHPEIGVETTDATLFGRNYFNRASASEQEDREIDEERTRVLAEAASLKKSAVDYLHPEKSCEVSPECFGRNYFTRYSSPLEYEHEIIAYKEVEESQEIVAVKNLAAAVKGANLPSTKTVKTSSADMDVNPAKKSASSVNMFGLSEEVM